MLKIMNILPVHLDDADNDNGCGDGVHGDDDDDDNQEVGCTLNVDGTLVAQLPPLKPGKTNHSFTDYRRWVGGT